MAATAAIRHNLVLGSFAARLKARGKPYKVIVTAVMRKLVHQIYGILRSGRAYDPAHA